MPNIVNGLGQVKVGVRTQVSTSNLLLDTYTGAAAAYSLRKLRSGYTGNAITVRRSSDNTSQQIGFDANGNLNTTSLLSFVGAGNGFVTTWFDQSGNGRDATQVIATNQPQIVSGGVIYLDKGKPVIANPSVAQLTSLLTPIETSTLGLPVTTIFAGKINSLGSNPFNNVGFYLGGTANTGGGSRYEMGVANTNYFMTRRNNGGTVSSTCGAYNTNTFISQAFFGTSQINSRKDGVDYTPVNYSGTAFTDVNTFKLMGGGSFVSFHPAMYAFEYIFYFSDQYSNRAGIESNINTFYSIY